MENKYCEGCFSCEEPCGKEEKLFKFHKSMTAYEKARVFLGIIQLFTALFIALYLRRLT